MEYSYYSNVPSANTGTLAAFGIVGIIFGLIGLIIGIVMLVSIIKIFKKCGKPAIASIIPIWNTLVMCEIAEKPWWYLILLCIPFVNIYAMFVIYNGIAKRFGKGTGFVVGMMFIPVIFFPILGFKGQVIDGNVSNVQNNNVSMQNQNQVLPPQSDVSQTTMQPPVQNEVNQNIIEPQMNAEPVNNSVVNEAITPLNQVNEQANFNPNVTQTPINNVVNVTEQAVNQVNDLTQPVQNDINQVSNFEMPNAINNDISNASVQNASNDNIAMGGQVPINNAAINEELQNNISNNINEINGQNNSDIENLQ